MTLRRRYIENVGVLHTELVINTEDANVLHLKFVVNIVTL